ncbi:FAD/FMN-containing dehydrogenase [Sanguibacter gelidistatuariae]|uniref:FAD/FMN-containing dehydrogenase n=1 Tax=Sanguibacter gelidistatuariae TaxID=1814289 RepID=A0A1G6HR86_9MICO|nr:FAD-binding and (Fe-S)-binding domain-containing protein [Sanguibacter gelidistatuariae]SDB96750.1 FAD/FMN-containing dehydrogenase [Sanguibacter gelidistatuariae]
MASPVDVEITGPGAQPARSAADARAALVAALRASVDGEVSDSSLRRAEYTTDASNYRVVPQVVVIPKDVDDALAAITVTREAGVPITARGAGTSCAGNSIGPGVVIDFSRHVNTIHEVDVENRTARIDPGVIMSSLQKAAAPHGLRFGPDPSTQNRATLGGMIGNNACGPHAVAYGRTSDNVVDLDVVDGLGRRFAAGANGQGVDRVPGLGELVTANMALLRTELGRFGRQVSGYSLEHLLPENGTNLARALVGTEGTVMSILGATVRLVPIAGAPTLVVLGYPDMPSAADAVPALLTHSPLAIEGLDARLVDVVRRAKGAATVPALPPGGGWLMVEVGGSTAAEAMASAEAIVRDSGTTASRILPAGPEATAMWQIRADGAGLAGRTPSGAQAWPGWEDSAVPPAKLGAYLRDLDVLMAEFGVDGLPYGHFGDGCVHLRIDIPLEASGDILRSFMTQAAALVGKYGGSLSGEHGDGRARSELLPAMYSPAAITMFEQFKALFDPNDLLNPGVLVRPNAIDADLRRPHAKPILAKTGFSFSHDDGDFSKAIHRCVGVGKCRADSTAAGGFMCPSYLATKDEKDSTRGRARVLQEMANGTLVTGSWRSPEVHAALDLCLSCKACSSDCPAGVDMAQLKSEVLHNTYKGRLRPMNHYALGWLPRWARLASYLPKIANFALSIKPLATVVLTLGGMDTRRSIPSFADVPFRTWWKREGAALAATSRAGVGQAGGQVTEAKRKPKVVLWTDSFSDSLAPNVPEAAVKVLLAAGYDVVIPEDEACCGLTWISTGQLDGAKKKLSTLMDTLGPFAVNGIPIVGLEPSCTAVLRSDLLDLFPEDPRAHAVSAATHTLAELLTDPETAPGPDSGWAMPDLSDVTAVAQPHCHQYSVMGYQTDEALLRGAGATITTLAGCCGLAGNFGMEKGHYDVSVAVAENALLPALRQAGEGDIFLADGFSCRTQADDLAGVKGKALAELLAERL